MARTVTVVVPGRPPNPNRIRGHWTKRHAITVHWKRLAQLLAQEALPSRWQPMTRARLDVVHVVPTKGPRDLDNLAAAIKASLDGMVLARVIADDSDRVLTAITHSIEYRKGEAATKYTFTEEER
jgi:Holliday junction resolvase RusA-like endonuclease